MDLQPMTTSAHTALLLDRRGRADMSCPHRAATSMTIGRGCLKNGRSVFVARTAVQVQRSGGKAKTGENLKTKKIATEFDRCLFAKDDMWRYAHLVASRCNASAQLSGKPPISCMANNNPPPWYLRGTGVNCFFTFLFKLFVWYFHSGTIHGTQKCSKSAPTPAPEDTGGSAAEPALPNHSNVGIGSRHTSDRQLSTLR